MITKQDREKFERIKRMVSNLMARDKKARESKILQDFEWVIVFTSILLPEE